jgi:hypothetical protein
MDEKRAERILAKMAGFTREIADDSELTRLAAEGDLMPYDPVWHPRVARWAHAVELEELVPFFQKARRDLEARLLAEETRRAQLGFFGRMWERLRGR